MEMKSSNAFVFTILISLAIATGILAWKAGFFSFTPQLIPPHEDSLQILGADFNTVKEIHENLELTGFMARDTQHVAIVNAQVVETGGLLTVRIGSRMINLQVMSITADKIILSVP